MNINKFKHLYKTYLKLAEKDGQMKAGKEVISILLNKIGIKSDAINRRKSEISNHFDKIFESTVIYGPFKGLKLSKDTWWGSTDRASMLFGFYEKEVLESLQNIPKHYKTFIDLGAADGYYAVGVLVNNLFESSICYESSLKGRETISRNAKINNVENKIEIRGCAKNNFYKEFNKITLSGAVLFIDIVH